MEDAHVQEHGSEDAPILPGCLNIRSLLSTRVYQYIQADVKALTQESQDSKSLFHAFSNAFLHALRVR
jgi:hypothetical protein